MREEQHQFLRLLNQLPARLTAEQAAWVLNCQPHDVPILVAARLLKPLGNPPPIQREILCRVGTAGTGQRPDLAGEGHECVESALAKEKCRQEEWPFLLSWPPLDGRLLIFAVIAGRVAFNSY